MQLLVGQQAPDFITKDLYGNRVALEDYRGVCLLLSFYRFAVCPVCNIRMWRLSQHVDDYRRRGLHFVACVESSPENIRFYLDRLNYPFPLIPHLGGKLYNTYGLESSALRVFKGMVVHAGIYVEASRRHLGGWNIARFDGKFGRLPADFLIGPDGRVLLAYYGRDHGDFLPLEQLDLYLRTTPPVRPLPPALYNGRPLPFGDKQPVTGGQRSSQVAARQNPAVGYPTDPADAPTARLPHPGLPPGTEGTEAGSPLFPPRQAGWQASGEVVDPSNGWR
jgi:thioredoxin-dependent peroxiredoxin